MKKVRFVLPLLFSIAGIAYTIYTLHILTSALGPFDWVKFIPGYLYNDILVVMGASLPFLTVEYFLIGTPLAALFLIANRMIKATAYDLNVMRIGKKFGSFRLIRRSVAPALFAVSSSGYVIGLLQDFVFGVPPTIPPEVRFLYPLMLTLMGALLIMPIALAFFIPTWILNDAGIVTTLKSNQLNIRQCPDTEGVGRWYSNMIGGYSLLSFPLAMFHAHFLEPYILQSDPIPITPFNIFVSMLWTVGIPLLIMAFIIPIILFHEVVMHKTTGIIQKIAFKLGAHRAELPKIERKK